MSQELKDIAEATLLAKELLLIDEATAFMTDHLPDPEQAVSGRKWMRDNIEYQERINTLKLGVGTRLRKRTLKLKQVEADLRDNLKEEGFRAFEERSVMCHREGAYRDLAAEVGDLETLWSRLDFIEWTLKGLAKFVAK
jgi:hypothetical protein